MWAEYEAYKLAAWDLYRNPGLKNTPSGHVVIDPATGRPADETHVKAEALRVGMKALEGQRALLGVDAPKKRITVSYKLEELKQEIMKLAPAVFGELEAPFNDDGEAVV
jgi:predicted RNA-binding Zn ribbon-like protein